MNFYSIIVPVLFNFPFFSITVLLLFLHHNNSLLSLFLLSLSLSLSLKQDKKNLIPNILTKTFSVHTPTLTSHNTPFSFSFSLFTAINPFSLSLSIVWRENFAMKSKAGGNGLTSEAGGGGGGSSSSPSPPPSPRRQSGVTRCRRRLRPAKDSSESRRLVAVIMTRRSLRYFFLLPLVYISGLLMCVGPFSALIGHTPLPGSRYRSHEIFHNLWHHIETDNSSVIEVGN